ncbi:hypothetical protein AC578_1243 [Pseudocercospora eumusae]|uniref:Fe2OG dioxygenase domain-containing protein n=1 Tax=Pseudocercospora eumusae TaxID=321146 RepID=A0A139H888_9PEZI|nr:hypothetical protein AC578_1243 [Pseudocercospora eumusae]
MTSTPQSDRQPPTSSPIPIIDFSAWYTATDPSAKLQVARELISACQDPGFVYIINHGVSQDLLDQAFATAKKLFDLPMESKMLAPHPDGPDIHRGYSRPGLEKVSQYMDGDEKVGEELRNVGDVKESYEIGSEECPNQYNVWLPEDVFPGFRDFTTKFFWHCNEAAQEILRAIAVGLGLEDSEFLIKYHTGHNNQLRLLHYPPVPAEDLEQGKAARISAHTDWGSITMLFQDSCGGLEVEDKDGKFVPATPIPGACVMNVGDLLMRWSNDKLKSTLHRVTLPPLSDSYDTSSGKRMTRARYSIPYFVSPDPFARVECLPACVDEKHPVKYEPIVQDDYRKMRAKVQYKKSDSGAAPVAVAG